MEHTGTGFGTQVIHSGVTPGKDCRPLSMPIYQTSTFYFDTCEQGGRCFAGEEGGYYYSRMGNPTVQLLEEKIAALEGAEAAVAAGSGMGAISSALWSIAGAGKHILADKTLYGCTFALLSHGMTRYGVPDFRLPRDVVDRELGWVLEAGVRARVKESVPAQARADVFAALFAACMERRGALTKEEFDAVCRAAQEEGT